MKQETKDYIEQVTSEVREKFNSPTPIKDITDLINHMGGIVESSSLEELNTKGTVKKQGGRFLIRYFDRFGSQKEANWIVAVTLGHILLHLRWGTNPKHWCKFPDADLIIHATDAQKEQAELFAMNLLLPAEHLEVMFDEVTGDRDLLGFDDLDVLAEYFAVPTLKIYQRLTDLQMIE